MPSIYGTVIEVHSGTTVIVQRNCCRSIVVVNLNYRNIASEEMAVLALKRMILGQRVRVTFDSYNSDKTITGIMYLGKINVNMYLGDTGEHRNSLSQIRRHFPLRKIE